MGWDVLRLDAMMSENVLEQKEVYSGIQTYEGFRGILKNGDNSPQYYTVCRGWFPVGADVNVVIKRKHVISNIAEIIYAHGYTNVGGVDIGKKDTNSSATLRIRAPHWALVTSSTAEKIAPA